MSAPGAPRWLDGRWLAADEALAPLEASGVFETVRCAGGAPSLAREHLARMAHGADALGLPWPPAWDPLALLRAGARALGPEACALRLTWAPPHLALVPRALVPPSRAPLALLSEPGRVEPPRPFGVKTVRRAAYDELFAEARRAGAFDALVRARSGELIEGTISNVFVARAGELATPPLASGALPGIVRAALLAELARAPLVDERGRSWCAVERVLTGADLAAAEEVVLTNSIVRVLGLARLRGAGGAEAKRDDLPGASGLLARALLGLLSRVEALDRERADPGSGAPEALGSGPSGVGPR